MKSTCPTLCSLLDLGFELTPDNMGMPCISYKFSNINLEARHVVNRFFQKTVMLTGILKTPNSMTLVQTEIPDDLETPIAAAAWLSYSLSSHEHDLGPLPNWMIEGKNCWDLIPFVREMNEYRDRPRCEIERDYARVLREKLRNELLKSSENFPVLFMFDGRVLRIQTPQNTLDVIATGNEWPDAYAVMMGSQTKLPSRFMSPQVELSFYKDRFTFGSYQYVSARAIAAQTLH